MNIYLSKQGSSAPPFLCYPERRINDRCSFKHQCDLDNHSLKQGAQENDSTSFLWLSCGQKDGQENCPTCLDFNGKARLTQHIVWDTRECVHLLFLGMRVIFTLCVTCGTIYCRSWLKIFTLSYLLLGENEIKKEEVIPLWCQELSPNQEKLGCHRVCHYHQNEAWQRFRVE